MAKANTEDQILLATNTVLRDYDSEIMSASSKMTRIRIISGDRVKAKQQIESALLKEQIEYFDALKHPNYARGWPVSSFSGTVVESTLGTLTEFVYKQKGGGGSGAGADITKLTESAQCVFAAVRAITGKSDSATVFDVNNIRKASSKFDIPADIARNDCERIRRDLSEDWISSCDKGAAKIIEKLGKNYIFHRGSKTVDRIEGAFKRVSKKEGIRMDQNKWSPADIYLISSAFNPACLGEEESIRGLNQCMQERIQKNVAIGVSLKKITGGAIMKPINFDKKQKTEQKFSRFEMGKKSLDGYIHFQSGVKIQFRTFGGSKLTGWQGEVKGASANQGKISLGPVNLLIKQHIGGAKQIPTTAARMVVSNRDQVIADIKKGMIKFAKASPNELKLIFDDPKIITDPFLYSKWQAVKLFELIDSLPKNKKDQLCEDFLLYASSQSSISAPYYKLE